MNCFSFMSPKTLPIGLHLGPQSATLVQLSGPPDNLQLYASAHGDFDLAEDATPEQQEQEISAMLQRLVGEHRFKGREVVTCLGSPELFVHNVRLPKLPPEEVAKAVLWEAEERLPFPLAEAEVRHLLAGEVRQDASTKQEVILLACRNEIIQRQIQVLERAGLVPVGIDVEPCALLRSLYQGRGGDDCRRAYLHLGARATTVVFAEGDQILFLKYIASGGYHLDTSVSRHLRLPLREAARMRAVVNAADELDKNDEVHRTIIEAIRHPLEALSAEIELCLRYQKVTFRGRPVEKIVVAGEEASPWLVHFLEGRLGAPCEMGNPFRGVTHQVPRTLSDRPGRWATAVGLSLKSTAV